MGMREILGVDNQNAQGFITRRLALHETTSLGQTNAFRRIVQSKYSAFDEPPQDHDILQSFITIEQEF